MKKRVNKLLVYGIIAGLSTSFFQGCSHLSESGSEEYVSNEKAEAGVLENNEPTASEEASGLLSVNYKSEDLDDSYDINSAVKIVCEDSRVQITGSGADVSDGIITIKQEGTYLFSGNLVQGQILVDAEKDDLVRIVLDDFTIESKNNAAVYGIQSDKIIITLAEGTTNSINDTSNYSYADTEKEEPNAAIFSKDDITINGEGSLSVNGNFNHGVYTKNDLVLISGNIIVNSVNDGVKGKDSIQVKEANLTVKAGGDAIQSNNSTESDKGFVIIDGGNITLYAVNDGVQAETILQITGGNFDIETAGSNVESSGTAAESEESGSSAKGIKAGTGIYITGGSLKIDSFDDSVHSNGFVNISGGVTELFSEDDGIHADSELVITDGNIKINKSYEGLEGKSITVNGGTVHVKAEDDGLNAAGGNDASSLSGRPGANNFSSSGDTFIRITGGYLCIDASGDGIDANGNLYIDGGTILVNGPVNGGNGAMDYDGTAEITGGVFAAAGSSAMAQGFSETSTQNSILIYYTTTQKANTAVNLLEEDGNAIFYFAPSKDYQCMIISTPDLKTNSTYTLTSGGSVMADGDDGYSENAVNADGEKLTDITINNSSVKVSDDGSEVNGGMGPGGMGSREMEPGERGGFNKEEKAPMGAQPPEDMEDGFLEKHSQSGKIS